MMPGFVMPAGMCRRCALRHVTGRAVEVAEEIDRVDRQLVEKVARGVDDPWSRLHLRGLELLYDAYDQAAWELKTAPVGAVGVPEARGGAPALAGAERSR